MSGFDISRFVDLNESLETHLMCSICHAIYNNPVETQCGHTFCEDCIIRWINTTSTYKTCPDCRQQLRRKRKKNTLNNDSIDTLLYFSKTNRKFIDLINDLRIKCDFVEKGCNQVFKLSSLSKHMEECDYNLCQTCGLKLGKNNEHNCIELLIRDRNCLKQKLIDSEIEVQKFKIKSNDSDQEIRELKAKYNQIWFENKAMIKENQLLRDQNKVLKEENKELKESKELNVRLNEEKLRLEDEKISLVMKFFRIKDRIEKLNINDQELNNEFIEELNETENQSSNELSDLNVVKEEQDSNHSNDDYFEEIEDFRFEGRAVQRNNSFVRITVESEFCGKSIYRLRKNSTFFNFKKDYTKNINDSKIEFLFDDKLIEDFDTPEKLRLIDGDFIKVRQSVDTFHFSDDSTDNSTDLFKRWF